MNKNIVIVIQLLLKLKSRWSSLLGEKIKMSEYSYMNLWKSSHLEKKVTLFYFGTFHAVSLRYFKFRPQLQTWMWPAGAPHVHQVAETVYPPAPKIHFSGYCGIKTKRNWTPTTRASRLIGFPESVCWTGIKHLIVVLSIASLKYTKHFVLFLKL